MPKNDNGRTKRIVVRKRRSDAGKPRGPRTGNAGSNTGTSSASAIRSGNKHDTASGSSNGNADAGNSLESTSGISGSTDTTSGINSDRGTGIDERTTAGTATGSNSDGNRSDGTGTGNDEPGPRKRGRKPGSRNKKTSLVLDDDVTDITNMVVAIGDGAKVATGYEGFEIAPAEAETFAKPAARILARHGALAETIRTVADPFALIVAAASIAGPRIAGYKMFLAMNQGAVPQPIAEPVPPQIVNDNVVDMTSRKGPLSDRQTVLQFMDDTVGV